MGRDGFEFARIGSSDEIAEYVASLAMGLKQGEVSLESGEQTLRLVPASNIKLEMKVKQKDQKGKIDLEIGWKRGTATKATDLRIQISPPRSGGHPAECS